MRRSRSKVKKKANIKKRIVIASFIILLPILSIAIGYFGTKYFIIPKFFKEESLNRVEDQEHPANITNETDGNEAVEDEKSVPKESEEAKYTLELPALTIYSIQVVSFTDFNHAEVLLKELKDKNIEGVLIKSDNYKVLTRSFLDREKAEAHLNDIRDSYQDAFIMTVNIPIRTLAYGDSSKGYSEAAKNGINRLHDYYRGFYDILTKTSSREISKEDLNGIKDILKDIETVIGEDTQGNDFENLRSKILDITVTAKGKLDNLGEEDIIPKLWNVFSESLNKYINIL